MSQEFEKLWALIDSQGYGEVHAQDLLSQVDAHIMQEGASAILTRLKNAGKPVSKEALREALDGTDIFVLGKACKEGKGFVASGMVGHHTIEYEEVQGIAGFINHQLKGEASLDHLLPLNEDGMDIFEKVADGILLCQLINMAVPDTIDKRAINKAKKGKTLSVFEALENLDLALASASAIGCIVIGMDRHSLRDGSKRPHLVLGLVWQIIEKQLFEGINVTQIPGLKNLLRDGEDINDLLRLSPTEILLRWVNYQLEQKGVPKQIDNFKSDIKDSEAFTHLVNAIAPKDKGVTTDPLKVKDLTERADAMLDEADKIGCREFISAKDVVRGKEKLCIAFTANLLNNYPNMDVEEEEEVIVETRYEKTYRNWMNSLGVKPKVKYLYPDLDNGLVLFQLMDFIQPGIVNWNKVIKNFSPQTAKAKLEQGENCTYAVDLSKEMGLSLPGTGGRDLFTQNKKLVLGMVWQLMKHYTISLLQKLGGGEKKSTKEVEKEIIEWTNAKLTEGGKETQISGFKDKSLVTSLPVLDLIDAVKPGIIKYNMVIQDPADEEQKMENAKLAVSMARKIGAHVYALPDDLAEGDSQMIMTIFACIMLVGNQSDSSS